MTAIADYNTKTGQWMLVIHRVTATSAEVWVGTLFPTLKMPLRAQVELLLPDGSVRVDSLSLLNTEIRQRIADDYALHWQALGSIFGCGGTWMLPDDHEYWNDYPFYDGLIPALLALKLARVRSTWTASASDGVKNIQRSPLVDTFSIGNDLSFCFADLRSHRSKHQFITQEGFAQLVAWARSLGSPGVLVIPQLLIDEEDKCERNLLSFSRQYRELLQALAHTGNDIVVLSGDVHFGRIASVTLGSNGGRLIEVVSSPMSNLTGLNGIATAEAKSSPDFFPDPRVIRIPEWVPAKVRYDKSFQVKSKPGFLMSAYPKARTREHFMTVSFSRLASGEIELSVNAWRIRERCKPDNLPVSDFEQPFRVVLRKIPSMFRR